jgi:hypothetical protein
MEQIKLVVYVTAKDQIITFFKKPHPLNIELISILPMVYDSGALSEDFFNVIITPKFGNAMTIQEIFDFGRQVEQQ